MTIHWIAQSLLAPPSEHRDAPSPPHFNPRPPGVIQSGSITDFVLSVFRAYPRRWLTAADLLAVARRKRGTVSWALVYLRALGHIEEAPDHRNRRYKRYRLAINNKATPKD